MTLDDDIEPGEGAQAVREKFARLVREMFEQTGMSTNAFEQEYQFGDGMVSKVQTNKQVPSFRFVEALVHEAETLAGITPEVAEHIYDSYGDMLERLAADPSAKRTSTTHARMLGDFKNRMAVRHLTAELAATLYELEGVSEQLGRYKADRDSGRPLDEDTMKSLVRQHKELVVRRGALVAQRTVAARELHRAQTYGDFVAVPAETDAASVVEAVVRLRAAGQHGAADHILRATAARPPADVADTALRLRKTQAHRDASRLMGMASHRSERDVAEIASLLRAVRDFWLADRIEGRLPPPFRKKP
ncbi:hypothetical protein ACFYYS_40460 [Streptomyces sp. NPDC002120]|uniref:hypothetical protein n=1 Tax=Streptomyces sp. NPDC002120 TaxID=3364631 RepID=UPI003690BF71